MIAIISLIFVLVATLDVLVIGFSYGIKQIFIGFKYNLLISLIAGIGTFMAMLLGEYIARFSGLHIGNFIGGAILFLLGIKIIFDEYKKKQNFIIDLKTNPYAIDINHSGNIEPFEIVVLAVALSLNNFGLGISASLFGLNIYIISILSIICSIVFFSLGNFLGAKLKNNYILKYSNIFSAIVIITLAIYTVLE